MFNISTLALRADTIDIQLRHPGTGELLFSDEAKTKPVAVEVYGKASKQYRDALNAMLNRSLNRKAKKEKETAQVMSEEGVTLLVAVTKSFKELEIDGNIPTTSEDFRALYNNPAYSWIKDAVNEGVGSDGDFLVQPQSA